MPNKLVWLFFLKFVIMQNANDFNIPASCQIEILIPRNTTTNQLTFPFPDQPFLRDKKIMAIFLTTNARTVNTGAVNVAPSLIDSTFTPGLITDNSIYLTLQNDKGMQILQNIPLIELNPFNYDNLNTGVSKYNVDGILHLNPNIIVWPKSYIYCANPLFNTPVNQDRAFQFTVIYQK